MPPDRRDARARADGLGRRDIRTRRRSARARRRLRRSTSPAAAVSALAARDREKDLDTVDAAAAWLGRPRVRRRRDGARGRRPSTASRPPVTRASTSSTSRAPRSATGPRSGCSGRWPARSPASPSSASSGCATGSTRPRTTTADVRPRSRRRPRLGLPGSDFIFPTVHQVDDDGPARDVIAATLPRDHATAASQSCASRRSRCSRTTRRTRPTAGRTASPSRSRCSASRPGSSSPTTRDRDRRDLRRRRSAPRRAAATSTSAGCRSRSPVAFADAIDGDPADRGERGVPRIRRRARRDRARARGARRRATKTRTSRSTRSRASTPRPSDPSQRRLYLAAAAYLGAWWAARASDVRAKPSARPRRRSPLTTSRRTRAAARRCPNSAMSSIDSSGPAHRALGHERVRQVAQHEHRGDTARAPRRRSRRSAGRSRTRPSSRRPAPATPCCGNLPATRSAPAIDVFAVERWLADEAVEELRNLTVVSRRGEAAEHRDPERGAELTGGVVHRRAGARPPGRHRRHDRRGHRRHRERDPAGERDEAHDHERVRAVHAERAPAGRTRSRR